MKRFKNSFTFNLKDIRPEVNILPSMTVPNMTMSLQEILKRYTRGGEIATFQPVYQDHDDFDENPEIAKMDTMERMQYAADLKQAIAQHQNRPEAEPKVDPKPDPKPDPPKPEAKPEESQQ